MKGYLNYNNNQQLTPNSNFTGASINSNGQKKDQISSKSPQMGGREGQSKQAQRPGGQGDGFETDPQASLPN